jgi:peptidoglycan/xylan/chitin deacetylase (PgdA/CDA1 family)
VSRARAAFRYAVTVPGITAPFSVLCHGRAVIFMLHRFRHAEMGIEGLDVADVRRGLEYLRRKRYELVPVAEVFERLAGRGRALDRTVAFTMDDGYLDQATVGGDVFAAYDCPVTTFVTTGFLDGQLWLWWDRIEHVFRRTRRRQLGIDLASRRVDYRWDDAPGRMRAQLDFIERCKEVADAEKHAAIGRLAAEAEVDLPDRPPEQYRPMSWDDLRACEKRGMTFGPHTVTHPILGRATLVDAHREIAESWARLRSEALQPVPVFCYPNGRWRDFGSREVGALKRLGLAGALVGEAGYADVHSFRRDEGPFRVRRFHFPDTIADLIQLVSGVERFKQILRREA